MSIALKPTCHIFSVQWDKTDGSACDGNIWDCFVNAHKGHNDCFTCGRPSGTKIDVETGETFWCGKNTRQKSGSHCPRCFFRAATACCEGDKCRALREAIQADIAALEDPCDPHPEGAWYALPRGEPTHARIEDDPSMKLKDRDEYTARLARLERLYGVLQERSHRAMKDREKINERLDDLQGRLTDLRQRMNRNVERNDLSNEKRKTEIEKRATDIEKLAVSVDALFNKFRQLRGSESSPPPRKRRRSHSASRSRSKGWQ